MYMRVDITNNLDQMGAIYKYLTKIRGIEPAKDYPNSHSCKVSHKLL